jgi:P27 family predicted phage terminase small subunit
MTRGRRPPPTYLRLLRGNPQRRPLNTNEPQPEVPAEFPEPPPHIEGYAHDEWYRIGPELHRMRLLTVADLKIFEFYCQSYGRWRDAEEALQRFRRGDPNMKGLIVKGQTGAMIENPLIYTARKAASDCMRYALELGLSPAARARLSDSGSGGAPSKFGDLLA